jgi:poly-gamma-glutamate capsule biosynthesis protein CapA/YwtB (metallophosphatase superfamily)
MAAGTLVGILALSACTDEDQPPQPTATPTPRFKTPLAVVTHLSRDVDDLTLGQARAVVDGDAFDWADLGSKPGPLKMVGTVDEVAEDPEAVAVVPADTVTPRVRALTVDGEDPLKAGDDFALSEPSDSRPGAVVTTTIVGDIMLGRRVGDSLERRGDPSAAFRPLAERLRSADITAGNLESTLSMSGAPTQGGDSFGADTSVLEGLRVAGFDLLSVANNHLGDFGDDAIVETIESLTDAGFRTVGAGADLAQAAEPVVITVHGVRVGFIATDSIGETPAAGRDSPGTNRINAPPRTGPLDRQALDRVADSVRSLEADVVIALPHWGTQYTNRPEQSQRRIAGALADAGADVVVGGHPHWVQGWESIGDATVVHSLGNFVFDMDFMRETNEGIYVEIVSRGGRVVAIEPVPYVIDARFTPRPAGAGRARDIFDRIRQASRPPFDDLRP